MEITHMLIFSFRDIFNQEKCNESLNVHEFYCVDVRICICLCTIGLTQLFVHRMSKKVDERKNPVEHSTIIYKAYVV